MEKLDEHTSLKLEVLYKYGTDLTQMALQDKLEPVIGRQKQVERVTQILCKRRKNNACLVGDPGVGKTVIAEALAQSIANASVPLQLRDRKIFSIDMGRLIGGASNRGEFEERLIKVVDEVKQSNGAIILFIDELHTLIGAGAGGGQALDAANILKPALARGELRCPGATTIDEYKKHIEKDGALKRRFQLVQVPEPSVDETIKILKGLRKKYETHHTVRYTDKALTAAARLSKQYISDGFLPDKAIDLIDEAGSFIKLHHSQTALVTELDIQQIVSEWIGTKVVYSEEESKRFLKMEETLHQRIVGQKAAVKTVSRAICRAATNTIIIMTSNIGGNLMGSTSAVVEVGENNEINDKVMRKEVAEELKKNFKTEFLNRLDEVIIFKRIEYSQVKEILNRMLEGLYKRVKAAKNMKLVVTEKLKDKLVEEGYSPTYGARPLRRAITRLLEDRLAEGIINGDVKDARSVTMDVDHMGTQVIIY